MKNKMRNKILPEGNSLPANDFAELIRRVLGLRDSNGFHHVDDLLHFVRQGGFEGKDARIVGFSCGM